MIDWQQVRVCLRTAIAEDGVPLFSEQNSGVQESERVIVWLFPSCAPLMQGNGNDSYF
jgi:hypothetical protein